jgi:cobalt-zinc-cadmium efflux system outer membrane protein
VIVSQDFPLGGDAGKRRALAQVETDVAGWDYEAKRIEVATAVTSRFTTVLAAQRRAESATELVRFLEEMRNTVSALVETGVMRSLEVHQITRQLGLARIDQQQADSELFASRFQLAATWASVSPRFTEAVGELEPMRSIPEIETVIELAQRSPSIARWDAELARGQAALSLAKARRIPNLRVGAGIRWEETVNEKDYLLDVEIDLPILDRKQGEIREARYRMARAEAGRRAARAASSQGIAEFYYDLAESRSRALTLRDEVVPASRAAVEAYRLGVVAGPENLGDLLDARRDLARAEIKYIDALADYHRALATLEGIVGEELAGTP